MPHILTTLDMQYCARQLIFEFIWHSNNFLGTENLKTFRPPKLDDQDRDFYFTIIDSQNYLMLAITFCKVMEFHRKFRMLLDPESRLLLDRVNSRLAASEILRLRNKCVGHILDGDTNRPIDPESVGEMYATLIGGQSAREFTAWWQDRHNESSVVSALTKALSGSAP